MWGNEQSRTRSILFSRKLYPSGIRNRTQRLPSLINWAHALTLYPGLIQRSNSRVNSCFQVDSRMPTFLNQMRLTYLRHSFVRWKQHVLNDSGFLSALLLYLFYIIRLIVPSWEQFPPYITDSAQKKKRSRELKRTATSFDLELLRLRQ
jgi:hypothetical protein